MSTSHTVAKNAWVVGSSSGIGYHLARRLAQTGWHVAASARREAPLATLVAETARADGRVAAYPVDVTDAAAMRRAGERISEELGPITLAVLNAGHYERTRARELDPSAYARIMAVNFQGVVNSIAAVLPQMIERAAGQILINASVAGYSGLPYAGAYGASKAALIHLAESLRTELGSTGVCIRVINPGFVRTPMTAENTFPMPFLMEPEVAVDRIVRALETDSFEITFPRRFAYLLKIFRCLPYRLYFPVIRKFTGA